MKFLILTRADSGDKIAINFETVSSFWREDGGTAITFERSDGKLNVTELYEAIVTGVGAVRE